MLGEAPVALAKQGGYWNATFVPGFRDPKSSASKGGHPPRESQLASVRFHGALAPSAPYRPAGAPTIDSLNERAQECGVISITEGDG
jgi:hypothetical protein